MYDPYETMNSFAPVYSNTSSPNNTHPSNNTQLSNNTPQQQGTATMTCVVHVNQRSKNGGMIVQQHETQPNGQRSTNTFDVPEHQLQQFMAQQKQRYPNIQFMKNEQPAQHTNQTQTSPPHTQSMPYHQTPQSIQQTQQTQQAQPLNAYDKFDSQYSHCHFDQQSQQHGLLNPQYNAPHNNQYNPSQIEQNNVNC